MNVHSRQELDPPRAQRIKCSVWNKRRGQRQLLGTVRCCSVCLTLWNTMDCSKPGSPVHHQLAELAQTHVMESVMPSNHLVLCHPLLLLHSIFPSIRVFSNELALCIRWPKYWSFSISPSNEYSELISFRIDWFDLPTIQGTLKSLLQHHSLKASTLWYSVFFVVHFHIHTWLSIHSFD